MRLLIVIAGLSFLVLIQAVSHFAVARTHGHDCNDEHEHATANCQYNLPQAVSDVLFESTVDDEVVFDNVEAAFDNVEALDDDEVESNDDEFVSVSTQQASQSCVRNNEYLFDAFMLPEVMECSKVAGTGDGVGDNGGVDVTRVELVLIDKLDE
ncbi:unnamed protein product [Peronospora farinosa]|uniref:Uncharacterized protein n=1 Tax=Peronospora farinosa TaxID=134698 RepID=A0AAV0U303_9STRA|nr:unnamed protein product [Peronospora farinosa]CAI5730977.1 unnamed protein product [Peronospora farinosa]